MAKLAINGGDPIRTKLYDAYNTIGEEEKAAVLKVMDSGKLSGYLGAWHKDFYGGPFVQQFESDFCDLFKCNNAISVNSNTSGLFTAIGALGISPGDEVIVPPYTMSATAIAPLIYGAVPVFADVDYVNFGICPKSIEENITARTKAIMVVHLFGNPAKMDEIMAIAKKHNLKVIEDCAQAPLSSYKGKMVGTIGDLGIYSLNYHKHIHSGEGGVIVTNDDNLAERCQLIRNHGENIVGAKGVEDKYNTHGFNFRMPEIEASIGIEQLKKLPELIKTRLNNAEYFADKLGQIDGILPPVVEQDVVHAYYIQSFKFKKDIVGVDRDVFINAVKAEIPSAVLREDTPLLGAGYVKPLYLLPVFKEKAAFPYKMGENKHVDYENVNCPVVEKLHFEELFTSEYMRPGMSQVDMDEVLSAFYKVVENIDELKQYATSIK